MLSEFLVLAGSNAPQYLNELNLLSHVYIQPFDQLAAVELAALELNKRNAGQKRHPLGTGAPWQKVKFDRQIVAISKVYKATTIYTDDGDVRAVAEDVGIKVVSTWELPLPASKTPLFDPLQGK